MQLFSQPLTPITALRLKAQRQYVSQPDVLIVRCPVGAQHQAMPQGNCAFVVYICASVLFAWVSLAGVGSLSKKEGHRGHLSPGVSNLPRSTRDVTALKSLSPSICWPRGLHAEHNH